MTHKHIHTYIRVRDFLFYFYFVNRWQSLKGANQKKAIDQKCARHVTHKCTRQKKKMYRIRFILYLFS